MMKLSRGVYRRMSVFCAAVVLVLVVVAIVGCAPQQQAAAPADDEASRADAVQVAWSTGSDCESCHTTEAASRKDATSLHAAHADSTCVSCHDDEEGLATAHKKYQTGNPASKLKKTDVASSSCLVSGCHDQAELVQATADETVLTDTKGTVVNPHDLPVHEDHTEGVTCASCHKMHGTGTSDVDAVYQASKATCLSCHHNEVYECHTCHT